MDLDHDGHEGDVQQDFDEAWRTETQAHRREAARGNNGTTDDAARAAGAQSAIIKVQFCLEPVFYAHSSVATVNNATCGL